MKSALSILKVYEKDPLMNFLNSHKIHWSLTALFFLFLFLGLKILLNYHFDTLTSEYLQTDFQHDIWVFPPLNILRTLAVFFSNTLGFSIPEYFTTESAIPVSSASIPYFRDYVDVGAMIVCSFHIPLIQYQWKRFSTIIPKLRESGVLDKRKYTSSWYKNYLDTGNRIINRYHWNIIALLVSAALVIWVMSQFSNNGFYSGLSTDVPHNTIWQQSAYINWWASTQTSWFMFIFNIIIWIIILYYIIMHNIIGIGMIILLYKVKKKGSTGAGKLFITPQPGHPDGLAGLKPLRTIMLHIYLSIAASGLTLILVFYYIPSGFIVILTPLILIFLVCNPLYVISLTKAIENDTQKWKTVTLEQIFQYINSLHKSGESLTQNDYVKIMEKQTQYQNISNMPIRLFSIKRVFVYVMVYAIPVFGFLLQFIQFLSSD